MKHLRLAPRQAVSGGKPLRKGKGKKGTPSTGQAFKTAATALRHSQTALGAYYRRVAANKGSATVVFATARRLAVSSFRMLRWGQEYVDEGAAAYEKRYQTSRLHRLAATAGQLSYQVVPKTALPGGR